MKNLINYFSSGNFIQLTINTQWHYIHLGQISIKFENWKHLHSAKSYERIKVYSIYHTIILSRNISLWVLYGIFIFMSRRNKVCINSTALILTAYTLHVWYKLRTAAMKTRRLTENCVLSIYQCMFREGSEFTG